MTLTAIWIVAILWLLDARRGERLAGEKVTVFSGGRP